MVGLEAGGSQRHDGGRFQRQRQQAGGQQVRREAARAQPPLEHPASVFIFCETRSIKLNNPM